MIPDFTESGILPEGIYLVPFKEFEDRFSFSKTRRDFIKGLKLAMKHLKEIGCTTIYIDGSFVTNKEIPGDYDALWDTKNINPNFARRTHPVFFDFSNGRANQKSLYYGEFFPADLPEGSSGLTFLEFFQNDKNNPGSKKGIIQLNL